MNPSVQIRLFPDSVLRKQCDRIDHFGGALEELIKDLVKTMKSQPHGIGIAAPQIGIAQRVAIIDVSSRVPDAQMLILVNPQILEFQNEKISREGCMSLPDYTGNIKRYDSIRLRWQDENGEFRVKDFSGIEAVCIQHEVDHLNGVLFMDRVVSLKRDMIPRLKPSKRG